MPDNLNNSRRDTNLDILRGIGLFCIILAHVDPPGFIFQLRNFDVPLMVLVSGASFSLSNTANLKYSKYLYSRFVRLILPTWIFLSIFFITSCIASFYMNRPYPFEAHTVLSAFALGNGFPYIWIIRVFALVALITPIIKRMLSSNRQMHFWFLATFFYIAYEFAVHYISGLNSIRILNIVFDSFVFLAVPYGLVAALGMLMYKLTIQKRFVIALLLLAVFACMVVWLHISTNKFVPTQTFKYPPRIYYLSFAVGISFFLSGAIELLHFQSMVIGKVLAWIGSRTMWTYLWHILILYMYNWLHLKFNFIIKYLIVIVVAVFITIIQECIVKKIAPMISTNKRGLILKIFIG
jgi:fucose 4-O-acetylase-like acetyltransferase